MSNPEILSFRVENYVVFQAAENAIVDLGLKVDSADPDSQLIHFHSPRGWRSLGGEELSLLLSEEADGVVNATISARVNAHLEILQVAHWDTGRKIAKMVHNRMSGYISESSPTKLLIPANKIRLCRVCHAPIETVEEFCVTCGLARGGTAQPKQREEFDETEEDFFAAIGLEKIGKSGPSSDKSSGSQAGSSSPAKSKSVSASKPRVPQKSAPVQPSPLILECECGARLRVKSRTRGQVIRCPKCETSFKIG